MLVVLLDVRHQVPLHNLHVVDVVEQFKGRTVQFLGQLHTPSAAVRHIVRVIDDAVEQLHLQHHPVLLGQLDHRQQRLHRLLHPGLLTQPAAVPAEANKVGIAGFRHARDHFTVALVQHPFELGMDEPIDQIQFGTVTHAAVQSVLL